MDTNKTLKKIEADYDVMSIKYRGIPIWHLIRTYIHDALRSKVIRELEHKDDVPKTTLKRTIKSLFYFNPFKALKKRPIWVFCSAESSRIIDGKAVQKTSGSLGELYDTLYFESVAKGFHKSKKTTKGQNVIGTAILYPITVLVMFFLKFTGLKIEGENIIQQILKDYDIKINYFSIIRKFYSSYISLAFLLLFNKPRVAVIECAYIETNFGYILALKRKGVKVVEFQHGVVNENHYGYNSTITNTAYGIDYLFVFGENEKKCFLEKNLHYVKPNNIVVSGHYLLNLYNDLEIKDIYADFRGLYDRCVLVAGQEQNEKKLFNFVREIARLAPETVFVYAPRKNKTYDFNESNIKIIFHNIYDQIKLCDIHSCISSTTCLESNYMLKPNIFINIENSSKYYYEHILDEKFGAFYADTASDYVKILHSSEFPKYAKRNEGCYVYGTTVIVKHNIDKIMNTYEIL